MLKKFKLLAGFLLLGLFVCQLQAQTVGSVATASLKDVNSLSDSQIKNLVKQATSQGMTATQIIEVAKARGATNEQIEDVRKRIMKGEFEKEAKDQVGTQQSKSENGKDVLLMTNQELYEYSEKAKFE
ncbi:MAG: hypothetical protein Q8914_14705, partial [Bacteroidota bacterium]|nr:hypothetical protein [Bacteroidota bacterium]